ncbi:hypothetical protein L2E82_38241 [Cichorium intybus]|uniref:Uncharacterized protein n=1 Tax=Cichorium intybus TaxID=13427 RepID=A0ACB9AGQ5_CICIN|nr:hypothetical protein L2E82_38241 [Cichorium intybus]
MARRSYPTHHFFFPTHAIETRPPIDPTALILLSFMWPSEASSPPVTLSPTTRAQTPPAIRLQHSDPPPFLDLQVPATTISPAVLLLPLATVAANQRVPFLHPAMTTSYPFLRLTKNEIIDNSTTELDIPARGDRQSPSRWRRRPNPDPTMFLHSNDARQGLRPRSYYSHPPSSLFPENTHHAHSQPKFAGLNTPYS